MSKRRQRDYEMFLHSVYSIINSYDTTTLEQDRILSAIASYIHTNINLYNFSEYINIDDEGVRHINLNKLIDDSSHIARNYSRNDDWEFGKNGKNGKNGKKKSVRRTKKKSARRQQK